MKRICWKNFRNITDNEINTKKPGASWYKMGPREADRIHNLIWKAACEAQFQPKTSNKSVNKPPYWSHEIDKVRLEINRAYRRGKHTENADVKQHYKDTKRKFRKLVAKAKKDLWRQRLAEATSPKDVAALIRTLLTSLGLLTLTHFGSMATAHIFFSFSGSSTFKTFQQENEKK